MSEPKPSLKFPGFFVPTGGVVLGLIALVYEATTHGCAELLFDPIPTIWHALLVAFVLASNALIWTLLLLEKTGRWVPWLGISNGIALGVALFYSILFLPILPMSVVGILFLIGFLPFAPLGAFISTILCWRKLRPLGLRAAWVWIGIFIGIALLLSIEFRDSLTRIAMEQAASTDPESRAKGLARLRSFGSEDVMLRACYERSGRATDIVGMFALSITTDEARKVYYRATGKDFNSVPAPRITGRGRWVPGEDWDWDPDQGGEVVGGKLRGLSLAASSLNGSIDGTACMAYIEWTLTFKNRSEVPREARAHLTLPPGGVVSRLTLWINNEEREAAFAGRRKVREAYERVTRTNRDPALVTTSGVDRALL